jgi:hypothetical protein
MASKYSNGKRAHRATGGPKGGPRPGSGRKPGTTNVLPTGAVKAIKALNMREPPNATESQKAILKETEDAVLKVMRGRVHGSIAMPVLKAATTVREEICGPIVKKIDLEAKVGLSHLLDEVASLEKEEAQAAEEKVVAPKGPVIRKKNTH